MDSSLIIHSNPTVAKIMTHQLIRSRRGHSVWFVVLALWSVMFYTACTTIKDTAKVTVRTVSDTSRKVTGAFGAAGADIRHQIALIGIEDQSATSSSGFPVYFQKSFAELLKTSCPECIVETAVGRILKSPPRLASGQIDGYALAAIGRPNGLNFFVVGTLSDARLMDEKTGFWLWKDTRYKIRAVLRMEAIDSATGTKAMDETFSEEEIIDELRYQQLQSAGPLSFGEIEPIFSRLLPEAASRLCATLGRQPWQGFIVAADGGRITISAGSAVGLSVGRTLEVFGSGRVVESKDGLRFLQLGDRLGEARISAVSSDRAEAAFSLPADARPGGTVRLK
jgi:hypothetical protein